MTDFAGVARKYWVIFSIAVVDRFTYRTDFFFGTLMRFMPIVTTIFLWSAIFEGSSKGEIAGLNAYGRDAWSGCTEKDSGQTAVGGAPIGGSRQIIDLGDAGVDAGKHAGTGRGLVAEAVNGREGAAVIKRRRADVGDAGRNGDALKAGAITEHFDWDFGNTGGNGDIGQAGTL